MKRELESDPATSQQSDGDTNISSQLGDPSSPYLTSIEAAQYLRFPSIRAFYRWMETHTVPTCRRGRVLLFDRRVLDDFVAGKDWTRRGAPKHTAKNAAEVA